MGIMDLARRDMKHFSSDADTGFATPITFTAPDSSTATINGLATRHSLGIDTSGNTVISKTVHCSFAESVLTAAGYTVRVSGEISLKRHLVAWTDATGVSKTYMIEDWMPDDTLGLIVCRLGTYTPSS